MVAQNQGSNQKNVLLSIPRDLWIPISEKEENRIGAVYRIIEMQHAGKGANTMTALVKKLFQVQVYYYIVVKMQAFISLVDSLGGVEISLSKSIAGYPIGVTHLDGQAALAFARDRAKTDDFARMFQAQILIKAIIAQAFNIRTWCKLPRVLTFLKQATESNISFWVWLRLALMLLFTYSSGIESHIINQEMVSPFITNEGEKVIKPDWNKIRILIQKIFIS